MTRLACCYVALGACGGEGTFAVKLKHYEDLRDRLDRKESGWIELESFFGDGRHLIRLEDITDLTASTESYVQERDNFETKYGEV